VTPCNLVCGYRYFVTCAASIFRVEGSHFWEDTIYIGKRQREMRSELSTFQKAKKQYNESKKIGTVGYF